MAGILNPHSGSRFAAEIIQHGSEGIREPSLRFVTGGSAGTIRRPAVQAMRLDVAAGNTTVGEETFVHPTMRSLPG
jgi:hypothetical protein